MKTFPQQPLWPANQRPPWKWNLHGYQMNEQMTLKTEPIPNSSPPGLVDPLPLPTPFHPRTQKRDWGQGEAVTLSNG